MKTRIYYINIIFILASTFVFNKVVRAQDGPPPEAQPPEAQRPVVKQHQDGRGNMLRQLGLSQEQIQQIRRFNAERKPLMEEAQKRFHEANRLLDEAIYADQVNEGEVQARLKDVQMAQAEVMKIRFMNEFAVRRILTPDQLVQFRELRRRFGQMRENAEKNRPLNDERRDNSQNPENTKPLNEGKQQVRPLVHLNQQRRQF